MGQKDGEKWTAAVTSQPTLPKSDRLLGFINRRRARASLRSAKARASTDEAGAGSSPRSLPSKAQNRVLASE